MAVETLGSVPRVKVAPWNDPVIRGWVFQIVVVRLVAGLAWYLVSNTIDNLNRQKIASCRRCQRNQVRNLAVSHQRV